MLKMFLQYMPWLVLMLVEEGNFCSVTSLPCKVHAELGLQYRKVSWYKVDEDSFTGLVLRNLQTNETLLYKSAQKLYQVGKDYSLIFSNSSLSDCGRYHCRLWPPIGHQIKEGDYDFYPRGCPQPIKMQKSDVLQSKEQSSNQRDSTVSVIVGLVTPGGTSSILITVAHAELSDLTTFPCNGDIEYRVQYGKVSWYKVEEGADGFTGLVLKNLQTRCSFINWPSTAIKWGKTIPSSFPSSSLSDCGRYRCRLWPPIEHQIKEGFYDFYPRGRVVCLTMTLGWAFPTDLHKVQAQCNDTVSLPCSLTVNTSDYRYAAWYKLNFTKLEGIVRKNRNGPIQSYSYHREATLGDLEALVLPWVRPEDSGEYQCMLGAEIGKQNQFLNVHLNVSECVASAAPTFAPVIMATNSNCMLDSSYVELSPARILSGFSVLGLVKALLCLLSIWVLLKLKTHSV